MKRCKHARESRRIGPFRALNAVYIAVDACAGFRQMTRWWEHLPWRQDTADRVLSAQVLHAIGYYGNENPIHPVCRLARLTASVLLGRMLHADGTLSWRAVSVAVLAVKKVFAAYYSHSAPQEGNQ